MLSRRNIRTKLLETLYSATINGGKSNQDIKNDYLKSVYDAYDSLLFVLQNLVQIASLAKEDKESRSKKYLPDENDKQFDDWLSRNPYIQGLANLNLDDKFVSNKTIDSDEDVLKRVYREFAKSDEYITYGSLDDPTDEEHKEIFLELFKFMLKSEIYEDYLRDIFINYDTDQSHIKGTGKKVIKKIFSDPEFIDECKPDTETVEEFGVELLKDYISNHSDYSELIKEQLENWNLDRIALIDLICMNLGISELLTFETIPVKVTLNEYLELVKNYSTEKSSEFVNGVLDKVLQGLKKDGKLNKTGRGLVD